MDAEEGTATEVRSRPRCWRPTARPSSGTRDDIEAYCRKYGWGYARAPTDIPLEDLVLKMLREQSVLR